MRLEQGSQADSANAAAPEGPGGLIHWKNEFGALMDRARETKLRLGTCAQELQEARVAWGTEQAVANDAMADAWRCETASEDAMRHGRQAALEVQTLRARMLGLHGEGRRNPGTAPRASGLTKGF